MRAAAHTAIAGLTAFGGVTLIKRKHPTARLPDPIFAGIVAAMAAGIPDYLEPATNPHHRQFCHSGACAALIVGAMQKLYAWEPASPGDVRLRNSLLSIGIGYLAHLGADLTTAMGLPLIGKLA